jgi:hypothetical protein
LFDNGFLFSENTITGNSMEKFILSSLNLFLRFKSITLNEIAGIL